MSITDMLVAAMLGFAAGIWGGVLGEYLLEKLFKKKYTLPSHPEVIISESEFKWYKEQAERILGREPGIDEMISIINMTKSARAKAISQIIRKKENEHRTNKT